MSISFQAPQQLKKKCQNNFFAKAMLCFGKALKFMFINFWLHWY